MYIQVIHIWGALTSYFRQRRQIGDVIKAEIQNWPHQKTPLEQLNPHKSIKSHDIDFFYKNSCSSNRAAKILQDRKKDSIIFKCKNCNKSSQIISHTQRALAERASVYHDDNDSNDDKSYHTCQSSQLWHKWHRWYLIVWQIEPCYRSAFSCTP